MCEAIFHSSIIGRSTIYLLRVLLNQQKSIIYHPIHSLNSSYYITLA